MKLTTDGLTEIETRLAEAPQRTARPGTIKALVAELRPSIQLARAAGKTWQEIANDLSPKCPPKPDTVRVAYARVLSGEGGVVRPVRSVMQKAAVRQASSSPAAPAAYGLMAQPFRDDLTGVK